MEGLLFGCCGEALSRVPGGQSEAALVPRRDAPQPISEAIFGLFGEASEVGPRRCKAPEGIRGVEECKSDVEAKRREGKE